MRRRLLRRLVQAAVTADIVDAATARILRSHTTDPAVALTLLRAMRQRPGQCDDYEWLLATGERLGCFTRRERWGRQTWSTRRHPDVRWGRGIFPDVRPAVGAIVTQGLLRQATEIAEAVVREEQATIVMAFRLFAARERGRPPLTCEFDVSAAVRRLRGAVLGLEEENPERWHAEVRCSAHRAASLWWCYGESTESQIWISKTCPMSFEFLVGLLIHEALHDTVRVDGEILSCDDEHRCMAILGDTMYFPLGDLSFWQCSISY